MPKRKSMASARAASKRPSKRARRSTDAFVAQRTMGRSSTKSGPLDGAFNIVSGSERLFDVIGDFGVHSWVFDYESLYASRLGALIDQYEQWQPLEFSFEYVPTVAKTASGTIGLAWEWDPTDEDPTFGEFNTTWAASLNYKTAAISSPLRLTMKNRKGPTGEWMKPTLYTAPLTEPRFSQAGKLQVCPNGSSVSAEVGHIILHYRILLSIPQPIGGDTTVVSISGDFDRITLQETATAADGVLLEGLARDTGPVFTDAGAGTKAFDNHYIMSGKVSSGTASLWTKGGRLVNEGTRVYFRPASKWQDTATMEIFPSGTTPYVGYISLLPTFALAALLTIEGASAAYIRFTSLRHFK